MHALNDALHAAERERLGGPLFKLAKDHWYDLQSCLNLKAYEEPAAENGRLEYPGHLLYLAAHARTAFDKTHRLENIRINQAAACQFIDDLVHCNTRGTGGTRSPTVVVLVMTTTAAVVPARSLTLSGNFSKRIATKYAPWWGVVGGGWRHPSATRLP
jgi:hypothetical protein